MKYLNPFLLKEVLQVANILLTSVFFIELGLLCLWNLSFSISMSSNFIIVCPFLYILSKNFIYIF